jgi:hypothetical protein
MAMYLLIWYREYIRMFLIPELDVPVQIKNKLLISEKGSNH